jgi:hypothetical protein
MKHKSTLDQIMDVIEVKRVDAMRASRTFSKMKFRHTSYSEFMGDTFLTSQVGDLWAVIEQYLKAISLELGTIKAAMPPEELEMAKSGPQMENLGNTLREFFPEALAAANGKLSSIEVANAILLSAGEAQGKEPSVGKGKTGGKPKDLP